jgi:fimbrial chaperone protein
VSAGARSYCRAPLALGRAVSLALLVALAQRGPALASTFQVSPVQVLLSGGTRSAVLTVRNTSTDTLRFQLDLFAWDQSPGGEMRLAATSDLVFFPKLFSLAAGEQRIVRVGTTAAPGAVEKTYRIFVEELPRPEGSGPAQPPGQISIRTRIGIPIFLRPVKEVVKGRLEWTELRDGRLTFRVANGGTVHFVVQAIRITGHGAAGETVLEGALEGWYILAGGARVYELDLPRDKCPLVRAVTVEVQTGQTTLTERLDAPAGACGQ